MLFKSIQLNKKTVLSTLVFCALYSVVFALIESIGYALPCFWNDMEMQRLINGLVVSILTFPLLCGYIQFMLSPQGNHCKSFFRNRWKNLILLYAFIVFPFAVCSGVTKYLTNTYHSGPPALQIAKVILSGISLYFWIVGIVMLVSVVVTPNSSFKQQFVQANRLIGKKIKYILLIELLYAVASLAPLLISILYYSANEPEWLLYEVLSYPFMYGLGLIVWPVYYQYYANLIRHNQETADNLYCD